LPCAKDQPRRKQRRGEVPGEKRKGPQRGKQGEAGKVGPFQGAGWGEKAQRRSGKKDPESIAHHKSSPKGS